ncbi:MAG TPA: 3-oxoadipyl-CoA thiolase [Solirubrobacteraceae bacterium]|jgi:3-oxoadipyl-CoA thiolase|nr:3-oxoadipyl-CoA thiolase [Solirubrobacteraceae bacterium]
MTGAYLVTGVRTPIGRYGGSLSRVRPDDLAALVVRAVMERVPDVPPAAIDEVILGCANQAGEDNRNVARMAVLLSGLPETVPGTTVNRLCGSGLDAVLIAARQIRSGEAHLVCAGGVESMSRAPFAVAKAAQAFDRRAEIFDTTIGWRFVNEAIAEQFGIDSMPETAENVAADFGITRSDQDAFAVQSQARAARAQTNGRLAQEIVGVEVPQRRGEPVIVTEDEHPRATTMEQLAKLKTPFRRDGSVTAGNASGVNDGAAAVLLASGEAVQRYDLKPVVRVVAGATAGVAPRIMGYGPVLATRKLLAQTGLEIGDFDVVELNEAFAAQSLAVLRDFGLSEDAQHVNPNGGAIALGHPLGMSGARLALTAALELRERAARRALVTMCVGVGQGIAAVLEAG